MFGWAPRHYGDLQKRCNVDLTGCDLLDERYTRTREASNKRIPNSNFTMLSVPHTIAQSPCDKACEVTTCSIRSGAVCALCEWLVCDRCQASCSESLSSQAQTAVALD